MFLHDFSEPLLFCNATQYDGINNIITARHIAICFKSNIYSFKCMLYLSILSQHCWELQSAAANLLKPQMHTKHPLTNEQCQFHPRQTMTYFICLTSLTLGNTVSLMLARLIRYEGLVGLISHNIAINSALTV